MLVSEPPPSMLIRLPPTAVSVPPVSLRSELLTDTLPPGAIRMKSPPVVIVVGSVVSTGRLEVLENDPRTLRRLPPIVRLASVAWNNGRSRLPGTGPVDTTPAGIITTGIGAAAMAAANGARTGLTIMFEEAASTSRALPEIVSGGDTTGTTPGGCGGTTGVTLAAAGLSAPQVSVAVTTQFCVETTSDVIGFGFHGCDPTGATVTATAACPPGPPRSAPRTALVA